MEGTNIFMDYRKGYLWKETSIKGRKISRVSEGGVISMICRIILENMTSQLFLGD
jgi:hypothetical protein